MGSMTDEEYTSRFLELLRYVPYLKEEKANIHRFVSGFHVAFKDVIEFNEPRSLEEAIKKLNHCYEKSKHKYETKQDWRNNAKNKGKWDKKQERPQETGNKENATLHNKFNASIRGKEF